MIAIERDERCLPALAEIDDALSGRLDIIAGDALATDLSPHLADGPTRDRRQPALQHRARRCWSAGSSREPWPPWWRSLTLMFQREVAERIVAAPGSARTYGRLARARGWRCEASILFDVAAQRLHAAAEGHLVGRAAPAAPSRLRPATRRCSNASRTAAFGQRRKMLRQSLKALGVGSGPRSSTRRGLDETARAEEIAVAGFVRAGERAGRGLAQALASAR